MKYFSSLICILLLCASIAFAQTGPGGVGSAANNKLWLASDRNNMFINGTAVGTWLDVSGNGNNMTQATAALEPAFTTGVLNGKPVIRFDGSDDRLSGTLSGSSGAFFIVIKASSDGVILNAGPEIRISSGSLIADDGTPLSGSYTRGGSDIIEVYFNSASSSIYLNGTSIASGDAGSASFSSLTLGSKSDGTLPISTDIAEVIEYNTIPNSAERTLVENYLSAKYAITIANDVYNGSYNMNLVGIGRESDGTNLSASSAGVVVSDLNGDFVASNGSYMMFGHNEAINDIVTTGVMAPVVQRWLRVWYVDFTNVGSGTVDLTFEFTDGGFDSPPDTSKPSSYFLLYRSETTGNFTELAAVPTVAGDSVIFSVTGLTNGYYTIGAKGDVPLAVQLVSFTAVASAQIVQLNWTTASETNCYGFDLERKKDGVWEKAGFVPGNGTTLEEHNYTFTDSSVGTGVLYYRLKQIDLNGSYTYSNELQVSAVLGVKEEVPSMFQLLQNYPNPFNPATTIGFSLPADGKASLKMYDVLGRFVAVLFDSQAEAGPHSVTLDASLLPSGIYFYKLQSNGMNFIRKMLLVK